MDLLVTGPSSTPGQPIGSHAHVSQRPASRTVTKAAGDRDSLPRATLRPPLLCLPPPPPHLVAEIFTFICNEQWLDSPLGVGLGAPLAAASSGD